jgi:glutathione synthase
VFEYGVQSLAYESGRLTAWAAPVTVQRVVGDHFTRDDHRRIDLVKDVDVVLMRQDPPFDLGYITATHLLERLEGQTAGGQRSGFGPQCPGKGLCARFRAFHAADAGCPADRGRARFPRPPSRRSVIKPLHGNGGKAVFRIPADGSNLAR